ncbi:MAG: NADH-quinone oxidoreductase subunit L, partial [Deinococcus sp.]|nr:NADH-quinone oxidoreductase subunit L [Deinococcus sp.]
QLGYMFLGVGMGAYVGASGYAAGMFHLVTQAFVKALLFLGAGSVIHALHDTQDMRQMGGLWPKLRLTGTTMLVASLAISGFPLLSGFFSKDEVLFQAFAGGKYLLWAVGLLTALLTAFYMFRLFSLTFLGKPRDQHLAEAAHESPLVMTVPLLALAALSIVGGFIGWPGSTGSALEHFLEPALHSTELDRVLSLEPAHPNKVLLAVLSAVVGLAGIALGLRTYWRRQIPDPVQERLGGAFDLMGRQYQLDDAYRAVAVGGGNALCQVAADHLDQGGIDWLVNAAARATGAAGRWLRLIQSGLVRHYALAVALGVVGIMVYLAIRVMS